MRFPSSWPIHTSLYVTYALILLTLHWPEDTEAQRRSRYSRRRSTSKAPGPNMCKVQEVIGTKQRFFTHCVAKHLKVICERPTYERWECCPGFKKKGREKGCTEEKPLGNLLDTAEELKLKLFHNLVNSSSKLRPELRDYGAYTVFAPSDDAIREASEAVRSELNDEDSPILRYHLAPGRLNISTFRRKNQEFVTMFNQEKIRVNKYAYGVATVNCARVIRPDELATNGIIHVIDKVITPNDLGATLAERLFTDERFSQFQLALFVSGMLKTLKRKRATLTVLAPTNQAFAKLPNDVIDRILTDADTAEKVIKRHIVKGVVCSDAIVVSVGLKTLDGDRLLFRCKKDGLRVNEAGVTQRDITASNGVLHAIDTVLLPDFGKKKSYNVALKSDHYVGKVKKASELMYDMHLDRFLELARKAGLNNTFDDDEDITVFSPSDSAISRLPAHYLAALSEEPLKMKNFLNYHIVKGKLTKNTLIGDTALQTKAKVDVRIKVNIYRDGILVDKANLKSYPRHCRNAVIHKVDDVLIPHEETFKDVIKNDPDLSIFAELYKSSGLEHELSEADIYTLIAPTNTAFDRLDPMSWLRIRKDPSRLRQFLSRHVINRMVLKCSIPEKGVYGIKSLQGDITKFTMDTIKRVVLNKHSRAPSGDTLTSNGVLYKVDHVLPCSCEKTLRTRRGQYIYSHSYRRL